MKIPITENLPPDAPASVCLPECSVCGGYLPGCCETRRAKGVMYYSQWGAITFADWCLLECCRLLDKGCDVSVEEGDGVDYGPKNTIAIWREVG